MTSFDPAKHMYFLLQTPQRMGLPAAAVDRVPVNIFETGMWIR
jgi:hypothetical protein